MIWFQLVSFPNKKLIILHQSDPKQWMNQSEPNKWVTWKLTYFRWNDVYNTNLINIQQFVDFYHEISEDHPENPYTACTLQTMNLFPRASVWNKYTYTNPYWSANHCATSPAKMATREFPSTPILKVWDSSSGS